MVEPLPGIEQSLAQARQGDAESLNRLLESFRDSLLEVAGRELTPLGRDETEISRAVEETLEHALRQFDGFEGATSGDLSAWLSELLRRREGSASERTLDFDARRKDGAVHKPQPDESPPDSGPEETLHKPAPNETLQMPAAGEGRAMENGETLISDGPPRDLPTLTVGAGGAADALPAKKQFGDYELLDTIARGGMGVVYKARQRKLNRIVALKMILAGQFADQVEIDRFYVEAEAAANLRHPNIVAVHEVGEAEGQHFFSMDFVDGESLADKVRNRPLSPQLAAKYAKTIAETMQFAHEQGILHRDLKPSNVLLDRGSGELLITDFGLAKRTSGESQLTMTGTIVGTPSYMPPEQASGDGENVSAKSDVYSTGAILYELLTGSPPFSAANPFETIKQVLEVEPASPRLRNASIPRDLETICLKCLQKEPARRYATAGALAEELQRYLDGLPILARPVGPLGRVWRWCVRNPVIALLLCTAAFGFVAAVTGITAGYIRATIALADARQSFNQARKAIDRLFTIVSEDRLLNEPGFQALRKELLLNARDLYEQILAQRGDDPAIRDELALSYFRLGRIMYEVDSPDDALKSLHTALALQEELYDETPNSAEIQLALSDTLNEIGKSQIKLAQLDEAESNFQRAEVFRRQLAGGTPDSAEISRKLANTHMNLGLVEKTRGQIAGEDYEQARAHFLESSKHYGQAQEERRLLLQKHPENVKVRLDLAKGYFNLHLVNLRLLDDEQAAENLRAAIEAFDQLLAADSKNLDNRFRRAVCIQQLGAVSVFLKNLDEAHRHFDDAGREFAQLADRNPDVHKYEAARVAIYMNKGMLYVQGEKYSEALAAYGQSLQILRPLVQRFPEPEYRRDLGSVLRETALQHFALGQTDQAETLLDESRQCLASLVSDVPENDAYQAQLDITLQLISTLDEPPANANGVNP